MAGYSMEDFPSSCRTAQLCPSSASVDLPLDPTVSRESRPSSWWGIADDVPLATIFGIFFYRVPSVKSQLALRLGLPSQSLLFKKKIPFSLFIQRQFCPWITEPSVDSKLIGRGASGSGGS
jgi:hypothetical protein